MQRLSACECDAQLAMKPHTYAHTWISSTNTTAHTHTHRTQTHTLIPRGWTDLVFALLVSQANVLQTCARKVCNRKCCPPAQTKGLLLKFLCCSILLSVSLSLEFSLGADKLTRQSCVYALICCFSFHISGTCKCPCSSCNFFCSAVALFCAAHTLKLAEAKVAQQVAAHKKGKQHKATDRQTSKTDRRFCVLGSTKITTRQKQ